MFVQSIIGDGQISLLLGSFYGTVNFSVPSLYRNITLEKHFRFTILRNVCFLINYTEFQAPQNCSSPQQKEKVLYSEVQKRFFYHLKYINEFITIKYMM